MADSYPISICIIFSQVTNISYRFLSSSCSLEFSSLEVKYKVFKYGDEGTWQKHPAEYSQHKIIDSCPSSMSQTSCRRKKPARWNKTHARACTTSLAGSLALHLLFCFSQEKPLRWKEKTHTHTHINAANHK